MSRGAPSPAVRRVALVLAGLATIAGAVVASQMERGPEFAPWIDPLPEYAVAHGYWSFRQTQGGWALPGYADWWMERVPPAGDGPIVSDRHHCSKQPEEDRLGLNDYGYTQMHGLSRAFDPARSAGQDIVPVYDPITPGVLGGASMLFINLVSGDNPGFQHSEVLAIESFVRHGGGLVLITDHTNCYFSAEMIQPLAQALGFEVVPATACELAPRTLSPSSHAWARMTVPGEHPVGQGVQVLGWMNGGIVRGLPGSDYVAVMSNSETGWADNYDPYRKPESAGFTGSLKQEEGEESGPHSVVIAGRHGQGRVVVLADQNAWGSTLIGYEDNTQMFTNALAWASGQVMPLELRARGSVSTLSGPRSLCTSASNFGFRTLQVQSQRLSEHYLVPEYCTIERPVSSKSLLVLPEAERADLGALIAASERAVVLVDAEHPEHLALLGLSLGEQDPRPSASLRWQGPDPELKQKALPGATDQEPLVLHPVVLEQRLPVIAQDDLGRPLIVETQLGESTVWVVLDAHALSNAVLGGERDDPTRARSAERPADKAPIVGDAQRASGSRLAIRVVDWLYW